MRKKKPQENGQSPSCEHSITDIRVSYYGWRGGNIHVDGYYKCRICDIPHYARKAELVNLEIRRARALREQKAQHKTERKRMKEGKLYSLDEATATLLERGINASAEDLKQLVEAGALRATFEGGEMMLSKADIDSLDPSIFGEREVKEVSGAASVEASAGGESAKSAEEPKKGPEMATVHAHSRETMIALRQITDEAHAGLQEQNKKHWMEYAIWGVLTICILGAAFLIKTVHDDKAALKTEVAEAGDKITQLEAGTLVPQLEEEIRKKDQEIARIKDISMTQVARIAKLEGEKAVLESAKTSLAAQLDALSTTASSATATYESRITELKRQLKEAKDTTLKRVEELTEIKDALEQEKASLKTALAAVANSSPAPAPTAPADLAPATNEPTREDCLALLVTLDSAMRVMPEAEKDVLRRKRVLMVAFLKQSKYEEFMEAAALSPYSIKEE